MCFTLRRNKICNNKLSITRYVTPFMVTIMFGGKTDLQTAYMQFHI